MVLCLLACGVAAGPQAATAAAPAAAEEYVLSLPGVGKTSVGGTAAGEGTTPGAGGVVGEQDEPATTTAMLASSLLSVAGIAIFAPAMALAAVALVRRGRRTDAA